MPVVSVIMAAYNAEPYIAKAIGSILQQTLTDFELLVVDDGSTDGTVELVEGIDDDRLRLIKLSNNRGVSAARNHALNECTAPYVAIMDADDISDPMRLEKQVNYLMNNPGVIAVGSWLYLLSPKGKSVYLDCSPPVESSCVMDKLYASGGGVFPGTTVMRTDIMRKVGFYRSAFPSSEDLDLLLRMSQYGVLANIPEALYSYRLNPSGITFSGKSKRDYYGQLALELWQERKEKGFDRLDTGEELPKYSQPENETDERGYSLNQVLAYFYWCNARDKLKVGERFQALQNICYAIRYQPFKKKNWISFVKLIIGMNFK